MRFERALTRYRDHLVGTRGCFVLRPRREFSLPSVASVDLYIHIPFCRSLCPYCPYNRVRYDRDAADAYLKAVTHEIDRYGEDLGAVEIGSVYIGGGTPTTMLNGLETILDKIRSTFGPIGAIAVESIPSDLTSDCLWRLRDFGVNMLSIGVQSFDDRNLKLIGRNYRSSILQPVIDQALETGFESVNVDLMFALPGQTTRSVLADLEHTIAMGVPQVTMYPLFTFPYSAIGRQLKLTGVRFPSLPARRRMYRAIHDHALEEGFERASVWGFKRRDTATFSSVTRDRFIGIGAGSASHLDGLFYLNTFSVPEYVRTCMNDLQPIALAMPMNRELEDFYWLYWRIYETVIPKPAFRERFGRNNEILRLFQLALHMRLLAERDEDFRLTERGAFWVHLLQNYYVLNYINKVWTACMRRPWPRSIEM